MEMPSTSGAASRMVQDDSEFLRGAIKRIKVTDFMSFVGTIVLEACPRVNVVVGPNGCGKSSIVTAICLGLAGSIKALGRQARVEECIRRGCEAFETEVTLSGGPGKPDIVVHRRTQYASAGSRSRKRRRTGAAARGAAAAANDGDEDGGEDGDGEEDDDSGGDVGDDDSRARSGSTEWRLNGRVVTQTRVKELMHELGIHFDNLCQFLPQERVQEFSNLGPTQLLESTEEAIGDGSLLLQHKRLTQLSADVNIKREELGRKRDRLARVEAEQAANTPEYQRLQKRNRLRREVEQLRLKVLWVRKEGLKHEVQAGRAREATEQRKVEAAKKQLAEAQAPLDARSSAIEAGKQLAARLTQSAAAKDGEVTQALRALSEQENVCRATEEELAGLQARSRKWEADVAMFRQDLQEIRERRAALPTDLPSEQLQRLLQIGQALQQSASEIAGVKVQLQQQQGEVRQVERNIGALEDAARRRLDRREQLLRKLEERQPGSRQLYEWIVTMRERGGFRRRVLGPLLMEIQPIHDANWAAYLEKAAGVRNLAAVVTEDIEDNNMIQDWLQQMQAGGPGHRHRGRRGDAADPFSNQILFKRGPHGRVDHPHGEASRYAAYGITHTLDQVFEATSDLVKLALADQCAINRTYVGSRQTDRSSVMDRLLRETPVRRIYTPGNATIASASMYDPTYVTQRIEEVRPARLLDENADTGDEQAEQQELQRLTAARDALKEEARQLEARIQELGATERALQDEAKQLRNQKRQIESRFLDLQRREAESDRRLQRLLREGNPRAGADRLRATLRRDAEEAMRQAAAVIALLQQQHRLQRDLAAAQASAATAEAGLAPLKEAVRRARDQVQVASAALDAAKKAVAQTRERLHEAEEAVKEEMGPGGPGEGLRATWGEWPDEEAALQELLDRKEAEMEQAQAALRGDEAMVLDAWERRKAEMAGLRQEVAARSSALDVALAELEEGKAAWLPELRRHMDAINESVKRHFVAIGCAGEVVLREGGDAFDKYAAEIRVQYRPAEPLRALSRNHHSGGERAVATMIYLMALQGVTSTPFRVVDEINQGMDSRNERRVFNQLVECSSRADTPQCFLMTPKLIANLRYNEHVRVHNLKYMHKGGLDIVPADLVRICAEAQRGEDEAAAAGGAGGSGGAAGAGRRDGGQQPRLKLGAGSGAVLGQLPWHLTKDILFYGRT